MPACKTVISHCCARVRGLAVSVLSVLSPLSPLPPLSSSSTSSNSSSSTSFSTHTMAWRSSGASNEELVDNLAGHGMLPSPPGTTHTGVDPRARAAFLAVDRADYAPRRPYDDAPQAIGHDVTISAPHMHALAVKHLWPYVVPRAGRPAPRVLDVGAGSGYLTHVLGEVVSASPSDSRSGNLNDTLNDPHTPHGLVLGVEHIPALRDLAETNMRKSAGGRALLDSGRVVLVVGDGRRGATTGLEGVGGSEEEETTFDAIHVGAAAAEAHQALIDQLRAPGRMFIPLEDADGSGQQHLWTIDKDVAGKITRTKLFGVRYVLLTDAPGGDIGESDHH